LTIDGAKLLLITAAVVRTKLATGAALAITANLVGVAALVFAVRLSFCAMWWRRVLSAASNDRATIEAIGLALVRVPQALARFIDALLVAGGVKSANRPGQQVRKQ
jgi:hypothetical protein